MAAAKRDTATVAAKNKRIRQEALREQLAGKGLAQQVLVTAKKLHDEHPQISNPHASDWVQFPARACKGDRGGTLDTLEDDPGAQKESLVAPLTRGFF